MNTKFAFAYQVIYTTHLPRSMSLLEYQEYKKPFHKSSEIDKIIEDFKKSKKIIATHHKFINTKSIYTIVFDSKSSFMDYYKICNLKKLSKFDKKAQNGLYTSRTEKNILLPLQSEKQLS